MNKHKRIYRLEGVNIDDIVQCHVDIQKDGIFLRKNGHVRQRINYTNDPTIDKTKSILHKKFVFLIHIVINRMFEKHQSHAILNASILQYVIGKDYKNMLETLRVMNIVLCNRKYEPNKTAYGYWVNPDYKITYTLMPPLYLQDYFEKLNKILEKNNKDNQRQICEALNDSRFYEEYNKALSRLKISYPDDLKDYANNSVFRNHNSKSYFHYIAYKYEEGGHHITSVDKNGRIYSVLTSTPRSLKYFLNIKFSADIHNSHPLLFNSILLSYYKVSSIIITKLNDIFSNMSTLSTHYDRRNLRKTLINNGITKEEIANLPADVLFYLYLTSTGRFWDCVITQESCDTNRLLRSDIKVIMFAEVFYSKTLTTYGKQFAKIFKRQFPNVFKVVRREKRADRTKLANDMMKLESQLFREILNSLYRKRFSVLSIHDAVIVLDTKGNAKCTEEVVKKVIHQVYMTHGLCPDVSIDKYGEEAERKFMILDQEYRENVEAYISDLIAQQEAGNTEVQEILDELEKGNYEIVYTAMGDDLFLHKAKRDPKPVNVL